MQYEDHAPPSRFLPVPVAMMALAIVHVAALLAMGRDWTGSCAGLWQWQLSAECNSSHLADPYSFLHLGAGLALGAGFLAIRPAWKATDILLLVVFSSTVWEVIENLPPVIAMFGYENQPELAYSGDSIVNSMGDTVATALGGAAAFAMPRILVVVAIIAIDAGVSLAIGDGYIIGVMRLFGVV